MKLEIILASGREDEREREREERGERREGERESWCEKHVWYVRRKHETNPNNLDKKSNKISNFFARKLALFHLVSSRASFQRAGNAAPLTIIGLVIIVHFLEYHAQPR